MSLQFVEIQQVVLIHQLIVKRAGSKATVRDYTLLHSAVERPKATFDKKDLYPSIFDKAAALLQSLCQNHPFSDGNKRTAWSTTHKFLWDNNYHLKASTKQAVNFMLQVDNHKPTLPKISSWLKKHSRKIK